MLTGFFTIYSLVIALMKDVPDIKGDASNHIRSFSVKRGAEFMFHFSNNLLSALFIGTSIHIFYHSIASLFLDPSVFLFSSNGAKTICKFLVSVLSFTSGCLLYKKGKNIDPHDETKTFAHYMFSWKLFYASYIVLPFLA